MKPANVRSVEAIDSFRAKLVLCINKANQALDTASDEVIRTRTWLEGDQRIHWEGEVRRWTRAREDAKRSLANAKLCGSGAVPFEKKALEKAIRRLREAQDKLVVLKKWNAKYDSATGLLTKHLDGLRHVLSADMPKAVAYLAQTVKALDDYANTTAPDAPSPSGKESGREITN